MEQTPVEEVEVMDMPGRDRQGRCWYTPEAKRSYLERYRASGLSQRAFCEREGLKLPTFSTWLKGQQASRPVKFQRLDLGGPITAGSPLEVVMPDGMVVKGHDASQLAALIGLLKES